MIEYKNPWEREEKENQDVPQSTEDGRPSFEEYGFDASKTSDEEQDSVEVVAEPEPMRMDSADSHRDYYEEPPKKQPKEKKGKGLVAFIAIALVFTLLGGAAGSYFTVSYLNADQNNLLGSNGGNNGANQNNAVVIPESVSYEAAEAVAENVVDSVVGVSTRSVTYNMFFGQQEVQGVGSGVIVHEDGYIVTNQHVISDSEDITVSLADGREAKATIVWSDESMDLAIIKIDLDNLVVATLGDSDEVKMGQTAIAIGNPLGLEYQRSLTRGVISGLDRSLQLSGNPPITMENLIQTDAAINSGNSGGPLLNIKGEVIGINTYKASNAESMGFAIPINTIKTILANVEENGTYISPYMGVTVIDKTLVDYYNVNLNLDKGIFVQSVETGSSADNAGLKNNDIILKMDGKDVNSRGALRSILYSHNVGDTLELVVLRDNSEITLQMTLQAQGAVRN